MDYLEFEFETENSQQLEQLIALLNEVGFEGFEEEGEILKAFISERHFDEAGFAAVLNRFASIVYTRSVVEHINWNQKWEDDFKPVIIGGFAAVRAHFHVPIASVQHEIIITPKMSFGTGHHATTYLMIEQMQYLDFTDKNVLDFGTGTGVLAILAKKMGAKNVTAIDYDEWSIINTKENLLRNNCEGIEALLLDAIPKGKNFDVILANINLNILTANMEQIAQVLDAGGNVLFSGFLRENEAVMIEAITAAGLQFISTHQRGDWIVILANQPAAIK